MNFKKLITTSLFAAALASATPIVFNDPYFCGTGSTNGAQCTTNVQPTGTNDVLGNFNQFDIRSLTVLKNDANNLRIQIDFNYGSGNTNFAPFVAGANLNVGDILFDIGNDGSWEYGAVLEGHTNTQGSTAATKGALKTGGFYQANGTRTAQQTINLANLSSYRPTVAVWIDQSSTLVRQGSVAINGGGAATNVSTEYSTVFDVSFLGDNPLNHKTFMIQFSSATCGNDVVTGLVTPEPATMALAGAALIALAVVRRRA